MEINGDGFKIKFESDQSTIFFSGSLSLHGMQGYSDINKLLSQVVDQQLETITLNLKRLKFLNSSGINTILKFVIKVRNGKRSKLVVIGDNNTTWQKKSLQHFQLLMPELLLNLE